MLPFSLTISFLVACFGAALCQQYSEEWAAREEFSAMLPSKLLPMFERSDILTTGECFMYCAMKNCSSLAYSETYRSCKLYYHPHLANPLPPLQADVDQQHQMYYKRWYCPQGWIADRETQQCYYLGTTEGSMYRRDAWSVCEERMMSNLVTFQTPKQRDNLYKLLDENAPSVFKWWTGYGMFDSNLWMRPVDEIAGYIRRRGDCPGNDIVLPCPFVSVANCAQLCDKKYRDRCVGFYHRASDNKCCPKFRSCESSGKTDALTSNIWFYDKVSPSRPPIQITGGSCNGNDLKQFQDVSKTQCLKYCQSLPQCTEVAYRPGDKTCTLKTKSCVDTDRDFSYGAALESYVYRDINFNSPCPHGVRYRDHCLNFYRTYASQATMANYCRQMGGKFMYPIERRKLYYVYHAQHYYGSTWSVDFHDVGHEGNYTTLDNYWTFQDPFFERWPWSPTEPTGGPLYNCIRAYNNMWANSTSQGYHLGDLDCALSYYGMCEAPISQSWPKSCRFTTAGREYAGNVAKTESNINCKPWSLTPQAGKWQKFPEWHDSHSFCRNPDPAIFADSVWCYRSDNNQPERCQVPMCPESDWGSNQDFADPWRPYATLANSVAAADHYDWAVENYKGLANPLCSLDMKAWCPYYYKGSCYMFYTLPLTHSQASESCAKSGWHLASITSYEEQQFINGQVASLARLYIIHSNGHYIGLKSAANGTWFWENGELIAMTFWRSGEPNMATPGCGALHTHSGGYWHDTDCWFRLYYICELDIGK